MRASKFIARKQWIVTGSDDLNIRVFNYNTMEKIKTFEAHTDYLRYVAVHPSLPYILTCSDDMCIKLWDWDTWECKQTYEGHSHYVMQVIASDRVCVGQDFESRHTRINVTTPGGCILFRMSMCRRFLRQTYEEGHSHCVCSCVLCVSMSM